MLDILIVEDNKEIGELLQTFLRKENYAVSVAETGEKALELFERYGAKLVILDIMLPGIDGYGVVRELRSKNNNVPIIMLSAKGETFDKVLGLELGADDYMEKPFDSKELVARVKAVTRRYKMGSAVPETKTGEEMVTYPDLTISLTNYRVICRGEIITMPPKELELLYFLASSPNQVFSREQLLDKIWGFNNPVDTRTVDVHIKRIREKIGTHPNWDLTTIWARGYKFQYNKPE